MTTTAVCMDRRDSNVALVRTPSEQEKKERQKEACRKCRAKKKEKFQAMERRVAELEAENSRLKKQLQLANTNNNYLHLDDDIDLRFWVTYNT